MYDMCLISDRAFHVAGKKLVRKSEHEGLAVNARLVACSCARHPVYVHCQVRGYLEHTRSRAQR
jgi:hypothetical protein